MFVWPFEIKVDAVIYRADGTQEYLGVISSSSNVMETDRDNLTDIENEKQLS